MNVEYIIKSIRKNGIGSNLISNSGIKKLLPKKPIRIEIDSYLADYLKK